MKLTDDQKAGLKKHMEGYKGSDVKSHRMSMVGRMAKGMSLEEAHKAIVGGGKKKEEGSKSY